jgi:hypothetical protein
MNGEIAERGHDRQQRIDESAGEKRKQDYSHGNGQFSDSGSDW